MIPPPSPGYSEKSRISLLMRILELGSNKHGSLSGTLVLSGDCRSSRDIPDQVERTGILFSVMPSHPEVPTKGSAPSGQDFRVLLDMAFSTTGSKIGLNEVTDFLHMSGECLCGAYAHPGELQEIEMWYPAVAAEIRALEKEAAERGIPQCTWGRGDGRHCQSGCNT